uniref:Uncharacterized protein n=1 Tax=Anguilla anguilla TaxID=7936 RepID=A0A0E9VS51_ANGAN
MYCTKIYCTSTVYVQTQLSFVAVVNHHS